jgi:hypothetical protein
MSFTSNIEQFDVECNAALTLWERRRGKCVCTFTPVPGKGTIDPFSRRQGGGQDEWTGNSQVTTGTTIGTLNEGPLHAALKASYLTDGGESEVSVGNFVADAVAFGVTYEIQTGSFSGLQRKLSVLLEAGPLVLVHPIAARKTIIKLPTAEDEEATRRRSPKKGHISHIVSQLVYIPQLLNHPNFAVEAVLVDVEEVRIHDPKKVRRRGGWRVHERRLVEIKDRLRIRTALDLYEFLHEPLPSPFTTQDLAAALRQPALIARQMAYCLRKAGVTQVCGKQGQFLSYQAVELP